MILLKMISLVGFLLDRSNFPIKFALLGDKNDSKNLQLSENLSGSFPNLSFGVTDDFAIFFLKTRNKILTCNIIFEKGH
jgi:hypothetical protein